MDWEKDFDLANPNPSDNSDFDDDYHKPNTKIIQDTPGVSSENILKNRAI
jgi:hypothetical protein